MTAPTADLAALVRDIATLARPPRRVRVSEAVAESMHVVHGNGTKTLWSPTRSPYVIEPMDCLSSTAYDAVIFVGPARTGKTLGLVEGYVAYKVLYDPGDGLIVQITETKSSEYSKKRINRMLEASPALKECLSQRQHDNNVHDKVFRAGNFLAIKWPSKNVFASSDYQFVLLTDYDRMPENIGGEGSPFLLASKRTTTFGSTGITLAESSPGRPIRDPDWERPTNEPHRAPPANGILDLYNQGDRRRLYWQCPEQKCRQWFQPIQEHFDLDRAQPFCPHCGAYVDRRLKKQLNTGGQWIPEGCELDADGRLQGERRDVRIASFWMEGPAASDQSWQQLADKLKAAEQTFEETGDQEALKTVTNTDWGRPYKNRVSAQARSSLTLMGRVEEFKRRTVPEGVRFLVACVDVQGGKDRRFVVQIHGFGANREKWLVDRFNIAEDRGLSNDQEPRQVDPAARPEDWDLLTRDVLKRSYKLADGSGRRMQIAAMGVDTGGEGKGSESVTSQAYDWFRRLKRDGLQDRVFLLKGASTTTTNRVRKSWPDNTRRKSRQSRAKGDVPLYLLGTDLLKDAVAGMMDRDDPGAGYIHVPSWLGRWWFDEMTAEQKNPANGKWERSGKRPNEAFDLCAYALAVYIILGAEKIRWDNPPAWAKDWPENVLVFDPTVSEPEKPKPAGRPARRRRRVVKSRL